MLIPPRESFIIRVCYSLTEHFLLTFLNVVTKREIVFVPMILDTYEFDFNDVPVSRGNMSWL